MARIYKKKTALRVSVPKKAKAKAMEKLRVNNIKKIVKRVLNNQNEVKCSQLLTIADQNVVIGAGLAFTVPLGYTYIKSIIPPVLQGSEDGQRIGNRVNVKKLVLKYSLYASQITPSAGSNYFPATPFLIRVIVYRHKDDREDYHNVGILDLQNTSGNLGSVPDTWFEPYNRNMFDIAYSKQYVMQPTKNISSGSIVTDPVVNGSKTFITRKVNIPLPKKLIYADNSGSPIAGNPTNASWFFAVAMCNIDGTVVGTSQYRAYVNAESYLYYTDD